MHSQAAENRHAANTKVLSSCTNDLHFVSRCANREAMRAMYFPEPDGDYVDSLPAEESAQSSAAAQEPKGPCRGVSQQRLGIVVNVTASPFVVLIGRRSNKSLMGCRHTNDNASKSIIVQSFRKNSRRQSSGKLWQLLHLVQTLLLEISQQLCATLWPCMKDLIW